MTPPLHGVKPKPCSTFEALLGSKVENICGQTVSGHLTDEVRDLIRCRKFTNLKTVEEKGDHQLKGIQFHEMKVVEFLCKIGDAYLFHDRHSRKVIKARVS